MRVMEGTGRMTTYRTVKALPLAVGTVVRLSAAQAANRKGRIELIGPVEDGRYRLNELLTFKIGEELGIEGDLPRAHQEYVVSVGGTISDKAAKPAPVRQAAKG
jgi:hypothetical protein